MSNNRKGYRLEIIQVYGIEQFLIWNITIPLIVQQQRCAGQQNKTLVREKAFFIYFVTSTLDTDLL